MKKYLFMVGKKTKIIQHKCLRSCWDWPHVFVIFNLLSHYLSPIQSPLPTKQPSTHSECCLFASTAVRLNINHVIPSHISRTYIFKEAT